MAITLSRLFADTDIHYKIKLIAGNNGMKSLVRWVHTVEDTEVPMFLHKNELIFTTGIAQNGTNWILEFVHNLRLHGAIGVVLNMGPYIEVIPDDVITYCNDNAFPLFTMPWEMRLIDVTYDFCHKIISHEEHETSLATAFRNLIFSPENEEAYAGVLSRYGFYGSAQYSLMIIKAEKNKKSISGDEWHNIRFSLENTLEDIEKNHFMFVQNDQMIFIMLDADALLIKKCADIMQREYFSKESEMTASFGLSDVINSYYKLSSCFKQAIIAVDVAKITGEHFVEYKDTGIYKLIFGLDDTAVLKRYVSDTIGDIARYDNLHKSDYYKTLKMYIESDGSIQKVSKTLNVHRNTINYKIKFIKDNFGLTLDKDDTAKIWIALEIVKALPDLE